MSAHTSPSLARTAVGVVRRVAVGLLVVAGSLLVGVALAAVGGQFGPLAVVVVPVGAFAVLLTQGRPWRVLVLVVLVLPVGSVDVPGLDVALVEMTVLVAAGLALLARIAAGQSPLAWPRAMWWPGLLLAAGLVSTVNAVDLAVAAQHLALLAVGLALLLTTVSVLPRLVEIRHVVSALALVGAGVGATAALGLDGGFRASAGALTVANRATGVFTSPNQLGTMTGATVLLGAGLVFGASRPAERAIGVAAVGGGTIGLVLSLSRGAWAATLVALVVFLLLVPQVRRRWVRWSVPLLLLGALLGAFVVPTASTQVQVVEERFASLARVETGPYDSRTEIWAEGLRQLRDRPVIGQGPGNFRVVARRAVSEAVFVEPHHAHNAALNIGAEYGLLGLALVGAFVLALLRALVRSVRRARSSRDRALVAAIGAALAVPVVQGMVDYTFTNAVLAMLTWLLAGLVVAADEGVDR